jgi:hypothetical protein
MDIMDIWGRRTLEYIPDALARLNRGADNLTIRAISGNVSKGMEIAYILNKEFDIRVDRIEMKPFRFDAIETFCIEIRLAQSTESLTPSVESPDGRTAKPKSPSAGYHLSRFADFPVYHLLLDWWLFEKGELQLLHKDNLLITVQQDGTVKHGRNTEEVRNRVRRALCRCGLLWPSNWKKIAKKLSEFDDVILGVDTNVLYNCTVSEHLLPALSLINPRGYAPTPNWMLLVIPSGVIHELEEAANLRDDKGQLVHGGRMGFRALQEVIELNQSKDMPSISLLVVGEADPALDTRIELQGLRADLRRLRVDLHKLRADLCKSEQDMTGQTLRPRKSSSGDMIIRSQLKTFLRQLDFHKGAYFLTADKSNAALARAEGLCPIYIQPPFEEPHRIRRIRRIPGKKGEVIRMRAPIGKLVYDMAVEFRPLTIRQGNRDIVVECDAQGENIHYWVHRSLWIERKGFERLQSDYQGKFALKKVQKIWNRLTQELVGLEE